MKILAPLLLGLVLLGACNKSQPTDTPAAAAVLGGWKATDACALATKAEVAAAAGAEVTKTELVGVTPSHDGLAALSTCIYTLANGSSVGLLARESPDGDSIEQAIE